MDSDQHIWQMWARNLHRWGLDTWAAAILEAAGPLTTLGAQAIYMSQPLVNDLIPTDRLQALAHILEDPTNAQDFMAMLREASLQ